MSCRSVAAAAFFVSLLIPALAPAAEYSLLLDADDDPGTGCSLNLPGSGVTLIGIDARLTAQTDASHQVVAVRQSTCDAGAFGGTTTVGGGYPVGLNIGQSGADVVEFSAGLVGLGATAGGPARLAFAAQDGSGDDVLANAAGGGPVVIDLPALTPQSIPGLGSLSAALLVLVLGGTTLVVMRRRPGAGWTLVGLIVVGTAWAAHLASDGQVGDWSGVPPVATDAGGDASNGNAAIDLLGAFAAVENGRLYLRLDVADVENAAPTANAASATVAEDGGPVTINLSGSDAEGDTLSFAVVAPPANGSLGTLTPTGPATASVAYTPDPDAFGSDSFTFTVSDGSATSAPATVSITITPVNDDPTATDDSFTVDEDSSNNSLDVLANDSDAPDSGETLTVSAVGTPDQGGTATTGGNDISYTPAADFSGTETFTYDIADGNGGSDTATVTVTVSDVNDDPTITAVADQTIPEDGSTGTLAFTVDDQESAASALIVTATSSNQALLPDANLVLGGSGANRTIEASPAANQNGSADITLSVQDPDGGSASTSFQVTVTSDNDAPTISAIADQVILEDTTTGALAFTVDDVETAAGSLTVSAASGNTAIIPDANLVLGGSGANRTITATPLADANGGPVTITITVQDTDGGSTPGQFAVTVTPVNDEPGFTGGGNVSSDEDAGAQTFNGWATGITDGDGGTQNLNFNVTGNTNPGLFSAAPAVDPATGNLTYTSAPDANGSADITVELMDDGGTANGGDNTSAPATITITVNPINDPPQVAAPGPFNVSGNVRIQVTDGPDDLLSGANDTADGGGTTLTATASTFTSTQGGNVTVNADGTFRYDPPAGYEGADSFSFEVCDDGVGTPASACTTTAVNLNVSDMVWFVNPSASAGDGRLNSPFNDVDGLNAVNNGTGNNPAAGDDIFLYPGTHDGQLILLNNQRIFGAGAGATLASMTGITLPAYSDPLPATGGARPTWTVLNGNALLVAQNNTLRGFNIGNTGTGRDITGSNFGTLTVSELDLTGTGQALDLNTGTLAGTIGTLTSTSGQYNIRLLNVSGSPTWGGGTLSGAVNQALLVTGGTGTFSYGGSITSNTANVVQIDSKTGGGVVLSGNITSSAGGLGISLSGNSAGTYTFSGASKVLNTGINPGVSLSSNTGASINFTNGGLDIDTTTGTGFSATGGGTVTVTGAGNSIAATSGQAVNIANTSIGTVGGGPSLDANGILTGEFGMEFASVASSGGATGISISNAGAGGFRITGDGSTAAGTGANNDSGGQLMNHSGDAVALTDVSNIALDQLRVQGAGRHGINATRVTNLTMQRANLVGNGDAIQEHGLRVLNAGGEVTVTNTLADGNFDAHFRIFNETGNDLTMFSVDDSVLQNVTTGTFEDGISFEAQTGVTTAIAVTNSTFNNHDGDHVQATSNGNTQMTVDISNNNMTGAAGNLGAGITVNSAGSFSGLTDFLISGNNIQKANSSSTSINVNIGGSTASGLYTGTISNNVIGTAGTANSGGNAGIAVEVNQEATMDVLVQDNTVREFFDIGIDVGAVDGSGVMNATLLGNDVGSANSNAFAALFVDAQTTNTVCLDAGDGAGGGNLLNAPAGFSDVAFQTGATGIVNLDGYGGVANSTADIQLYLQNRNPGGVVSPPSPPVQFNNAGTIQGGGNCPTP